MMTIYGRRTLSLLAVLAVALLGASEPAAGQAAFGPPRVAPNGGGLWFSELAEVDGASIGVPDGARPDRIVNMDLVARPAAVFGVSIGGTVARPLDVRLSYAFAATDFDLSGVSMRTGEALRTVETTGGLGDAFLNLIGLDLMWRLGAPGRTVSPYAVLGAGVGFWDLNDLGDFDRIEPVTGVAFDIGPRTERTFTGSVGLGADVRLGGRAGLRFEVVDHLGTNPLSVHDFANPAPDMSTLADVASVVHAVRFGVGVVVALGASRATS